MRSLPQRHRSLKNVEPGHHCLECGTHSLMTWYLRRRANKYGAKKATHNGVLYHSKLEAQYAFDLDMLLKAGKIDSWERQVKISLDVNGYHIANYYCDFLIHHKDGLKEYVEIKSKFTEQMEVYRLKRKLLEATFLKENPDVKYTVQIG